MPKHFNISDVELKLKLGKLNKHEFMKTVYKIIRDNQELTLKDSNISEQKKLALTKMIQHFESPEVEDFEKCTIIKQWIDELK